MTDVLSRDVLSPVDDVAATPEIPPAPAPHTPRKRAAGRSKAKPRTRAKVEKPPAAPPATPPKRGRPPAVAPLVDQLRAFYALTGTMAMLWRPSVAATVLAQANDCAEAVNALAESNPAVKRALTKAMTGTQVIAVLMAHAPIVMAIMTPDDAPEPDAGFVPHFDASGFGPWAAGNGHVDFPPDSERDAAPSAD